MNLTIIKGNVTRDVEIRYTPNGMEVGTFGIASNRKWKDTKTNELREEVMFIDCQTWGKSVKFVQQYFPKGNPILITGRLKLEQWDDKETGKKRSKHILVCDHIEFCGEKRAGGGQASQQQQQPRQAAPAGAPQAQHEPGEDLDIPEENIPF